MGHCLVKLFDSLVFVRWQPLSHIDGTNRWLATMDKLTVLYNRYFLILHIFEDAKIVQLVIRKLLFASDLHSFLGMHAHVLLLRGLNEWQTDLLLLPDHYAAGGSDSLILL